MIGRETNLHRAPRRLGGTKALAGRAAPDGPRLLLARARPTCDSPVHTVRRPPFANSYLNIDCPIRFHMRRSIVITGIGLVTPLGSDVPTVWLRIEAGETAAAPPGHFDASPFGCRVCAEITDFEPERYVAESKMVRLMNREAQLAVAAAHLALADASLGTKRHYLPEDIGLFGATGLAGLPLAEVAPLIKASAGAGGQFDPSRFGRDGLKAVRPILSFKVLSNMPLCFVSICENIQGPNAVYTPWEGQSAQAIEAAIHALECGDARCALAGGCDVKTHELAFLALEQQGAFASWHERGAGPTPGEGAAFLVLEEEGAAVARGARVYARVTGISLSTQRKGSSRRETFIRTLERLQLVGNDHDDARSVQRTHGLPKLVGRVTACAPSRGGQRTARPTSRFIEELDAIVASANGDALTELEENQALATLRVSAAKVVHPKKQLGDLFAAAAPLQVGLAAWLAASQGGRVLANCFGHGSEQAAFLLESR